MMEHVDAQRDTFEAAGRIRHLLAFDHANSGIALTDHACSLAMFRIACMASLPSSLTSSDSTAVLAGP